MSAQRKILIVDDNQQNLYLLETLLKGNGFEVVLASNGVVALEAAHNAPPDMIISDILMPLMDGFALCRAWMKNNLLKEIPFVFYTATYTDSKDEAFALSLGAARFIAKPSEPDVFVKQIQEVIKEYEAGKVVAQHVSIEKEEMYYKEYSEALIRKLEDKMLQLQQSKKRLEGLYQISNEMAVLKPAEELILQALRTIVETAGYQQANFFQYDEDHKLFTLLESSEQEHPAEIKEILTFRLGEERGLIGVVGESRQALIIPDTKDEPRWVPTDETLRSALFVPVFRENRLLGVVSIVSAQTDAFSEEDARNITVLANNLAIAIENIQLFERVTKSEARYRGIFEGVQDAIFVESPDGNILDINERACQIFGYSREEFLTKKVSDLLPPDGEALLPDRPGGRDIPNHPIETVNLRANGEKFPVEISGRVNNVGDEDVLLVVLRDISDRVKAQQELQESETRFRLLAEFTHDWEYWIDPQGEYIYTSPSCEAITGYSADEFIAKPEFLFEIVHPNYQEKVIAHYHDQVNKLQPEFSMIFPILNRDGDQIWLEHHCRPIFNQAGDFLGRRGNNRNITARVRAEEGVQRQLKRLAALHTIDRAINSSTGLEVILNVLLRQTLEQLEVDAADILLYNKNLLTLSFAAGQGFQTSALKYTRLRLGEGLAGRAVFEQKTVVIPDLAEVEEKFARSQEFKNEKFRSYFVVPLIAKGQIKGALEIFHRSRLNPDSEWLGFLETLAGQAAIGLSEIELFEGLEKANFEINFAYDSTLAGWAYALELRDRETEGHSRRVVDLTLRLAQAMGIKGDALVHTRRGALLHDIGKMGLSDKILLKPGPLTDEEWVLMKKHPVYAYKLLSPISYLNKALDIPYCHHEKWDGSGYPRGLKGTQIPLSARIFAVVDVWDALRTDRVYRKAWSKEKTLDYIRAESGKHFDPKVVDAFLKMIEEM